MDDDSMIDGDEDSMMDGHGDGMDGMAYPNSGSGGLADGGVSTALLALLAALGAASIAGLGLGLRRVRNRS